MNVKQGYKGQNGKLIDSAALYENLKNLDTRRETKLHSSLYHKETITVVDTPAYYNLATSSDSGSLNVVLTVTDNTTQIALADINTQITPVDLSTLTGDGSEYVVLVEAITHDEEIEKETYAKNSDVYDKATVDEKITEIASGGLKPMSEAEFDTFWGGLEITASGYVDPSQP